MTRRAEKPAESDQLVLDGLRICESCDACAAFECEHDRDERDYGYTKRRPSVCLNLYDPATSEWPEGF